MTNHPFQAGCFRHRSLPRPRPLVLALALLLAGGPLAIPSPATARGGFRGGVGFGRLGAEGARFYDRPYNGWHAAWGVAGLASAATISSLVNTAAEQQATAFVAPQTPYQLHFASVEPVGQYGASFSYSTDGKGNLFGG
ncbi:hypothetical protein FQK07_01170 [Synechococcus sp. BSF8S]|uniref:hypothetical protein n=1 Tax=Synechococcales TaxID=1890424 RepID=UPI001629AB72|nr:MULTISPECIES: hypothetical protein [unclassified Synechococcus]MBC1259893.1 hypothetical protein [Synechococcus sp. BSF8S]MBC1262684.1 hypothetical protein [Synechococcus sp. BSA11S]